MKRPSDVDASLRKLHGLLDDLSDMHEEDLVNLIHSVFLRSDLCKEYAETQFSMLSARGDWREIIAEARSKGWSPQKC